MKHEIEYRDAEGQVVTEVVTHELPMTKEAVRLTFTKGTVLKIRSL